MKLVVIESPYAGDIERNVAYARAAMLDALRRGEAPLASHLIYTQPGILRDEIAEDRALGIAAGLAWGRLAALAAFYTDLGWSEGMRRAREHWERVGLLVEERSLDPQPTDRRKQQP